VAPKVYTGTFAVEQIFIVAAGLDSVSVGESEVLAQIKEAYERSLKGSIIGKDLQLVFRMAISAGKLSRTKTGIARGKTSIANLSIDLIKRDFNLGGMSALIIGTGKMARKIAIYLRENEPKELTIMGRNRTEGMKIAEDFGINFLDVSHLHEMVPLFDLIITATSSAEPILFREDFINSGKSYVILDVSNPPNIEPKVSKLENVRVYSFSELEEIIRINSEKKKDKIAQSEKIIRTQIDIALKKLKELEADSMVEEYVKYSKSLTENEVSRALISIRNGSPIETVLSNMSGSISKKLLRPYILAVKEASRSEMNENLSGLKSVLSKIENDPEDP
jgi:glutamyl-tRNA reductase